MYAVLQISSIVRVQERRVKQLKSERKDVLWLKDCKRRGTLGMNPPPPPPIPSSLPVTPVIFILAM